MNLSNPVLGYAYGLLELQLQVNLFMHGPLILILSVLVLGGMATTNSHLC